jgi:hypothetical protein
MHILKDLILKFVIKLIVELLYVKEYITKIYYKCQIKL